ncbi:efflux RND transporter periplasmic adaptor subunit [Undibacterium sp. MH2W]|uniref:efflux RND transporter periplasmic adaptor subunit n=1 Tax=Undibacterium sp. MH2W TaxID=3413044 RepID=UPI003BF3BB60
MLRFSRLGAVAAMSIMYMSASFGAQGQLASEIVRATDSTESASYDAVVESIRQTVIAAQVSGVIVSLPVRVGDSVKEGQILARIDARSAMQGSVAGQAQAQAARSALELATKDVERQRHLFQKQYISQSAMERAEAQYKATSEQLKAQLAQANVADIQSGFYVIKAPYAGIISDLPIALGDMAMPGKPMLTIFDPKGLRVTASLPQTAINDYIAGQPIKIEFPGLPPNHQWLSLTHFQVLPTIDATTHTSQLRIDLPEPTSGISPGLFARVWLPHKGASGTHLYVSSKAIVRRGEMTGLYVIDGNRRPVLRQIRLGKSQGEATEVLTGISAGERIAVDPAVAVKEAR